MRVTLVLLVLAAPAIAWAQEPGRLAVSGGYSFLNNADVTDGYGLGWFAGGSWRLSSWLSAALEVSRHTRTQDVGFIDVSASDRTAVAGARFSWARPRWSPFAQLLVGASRLDVTARTQVPVASVGTDAATFGTVQLGGGIETPLSERIHLRVGIDYRRVFTTVRRNQARAATGLVYRFR